MSQHVRIKALVGEVTRKACSAKRDPRNHHTLRLRPTMATRIPVSRRRVVIEITVEVLKLPLLEHCETVSKPRSIEHKLMPGRHKSAHSTRLAYQHLKRLTHTMKRPSNLRIIMQRHDEAGRKVITYSLEHKLQRRCEAERAERASLRAAALREKTHPAVGPQRSDVRRSTIRRKQEQKCNKYI